MRLAVFFAAGCDSNVRPPGYPAPDVWAGVSRNHKPLVLSPKAGYFADPTISGFCKPDEMCLHRKLSKIRVSGAKLLGRETVEAR
jgi:hypothetical protein